MLPHRLIRSEPGMAVAYIDWSAMEFGVAAALSGDHNMVEAYATDPYLHTVIAFGAAPPGATKQTPPSYRVALHPLPGMGGGCTNRPASQPDARRYGG